MDVTFVHSFVRLFVCSAFLHEGGRREKQARPDVSEKGNCLFSPQFQ